MDNIIPLSFPHFVCHLLLWNTLGTWTACPALRALRPYFFMFAWTKSYPLSFLTFLLAACCSGISLEFLDYLRWGSEQLNDVEVSLVDAGRVCRQGLLRHFPLAIALFLSRHMCSGWTHVAFTAIDRDGMNTHRQVYQHWPQSSKISRLLDPLITSRSTSAKL
jgi:hypothetical protein